MRKNKALRREEKIGDLESLSQMVDSDGLRGYTRMGSVRRGAIVPEQLKEQQEIHDLTVIFFLNGGQIAHIMKMSGGARRPQ